MKEELESLYNQLAYAQDAVKELQEKLEQAKKEQEPWEPKSGYWCWCLYADGDILKGKSDTISRKYGVEFQTEESAEHTEPFFRFYHRLCQLAIELNPSGKVGGEYFVALKRKWEAAYMSYGYVGTVFETKKAAQKAADIMNRDKWELPK